ncbi:MAG: ABC transporter permease [Acidobacteriia bacterium]|nr:ABC transporter permease [Terriglobia bacterium]
MHRLLQDLRYALRMLRKSPGLSAVIVLSLAIGIGANSAIFSVVNALLLRPLPYPDPDRLAILWLRSPGINIPQDWPSPGQYIDLQTENHSFEEMSISQGRSGTLVGRDQPERIEALRTSSSLFHLLGARPMYGRLLLPEDDKPGQAAVAILSYGCWKRVFGSDPGIVGKSVTLNGLGPGTGTDKNQFTVAGILQPEFLLNDEIMPTVGSIRRMEIFLPLPLGPDAVNRRGDENYNLMARLKPGVTMAQAQADVSVIAGRIREKDKRDKTFTISVVPLLDQVVGNVRRAVLVLLGSVTLVLLIACANVANLLLSRAAGRQKEVAIRTALGAGWQRLVRQLLTESMLLGVMGGAAGLLIARWSLYVVRTVNPGNIPRLEAIDIDGRVLAFTFGVSILTGIVFGLAPALRAARVDLNTALKAGGRNTQGDGGFNTSRHRLRSLLVVSELAFSLMLLIGAGLLIRSFVRLQSVSPGFNASHVVSMRLVANGGRSFQNRDAAVQFYRQLGQRISSVPGVKAQGAVSSLPFTSSVGWGGISVEGFTPQPGQELQVDLRSATSDYFRAMEIPLVKGRFFSDHDSEPNAQQVVLIDEKFAQRFWPHEDPIGKHVWFDPKKPITIVGVVGVVKQYGLDIDGRIVVYGPSGGGGYVVVRTSSDPAAAAGAIAREVHALDPAILLYDVRTMEDRMHDSLARQRFSAIMLGAFAAFALILAAVGVYGVMSYLVTQGTHDIGVRIALGARPGSIARMVVRQVMELAVAGIVAGLIGAVALTRVMASLLFGVSATDAVTFSLVAGFLGMVAVLASYIPARRATKVDPLTALREE